MANLNNVNEVFVQGIGRLPIQPNGTFKPSGYKNEIVEAQNPADSAHNRIGVSARLSITVQELNGVSPELFANLSDAQVTVTMTHGSVYLMSSAAPEDVPESSGGTFSLVLTSPRSQKIV